MTTLALALQLVLAAPLALAAAQTPAAPNTAKTTDDPFPRSTALAERVSPTGLTALSELVRSFVERDEIVGAELLVIVNGRTILHEGYGWRDREREIPMQPGGVFCVRSMTKPLIGAAAWMLIESGALALDTHAAKLLPAFDHEAQREITVDHLLHHHSGLPMSLILGRDPRTLTNVREVADLGGGCKLEFAPGTAFTYSDQGTDTLTALVEVAAKRPADEFVRERLLEPLGMRDSTCVMVDEHALRERTCSAYTGASGAWVRYWDPTQPQLFGAFLGSQGLYSTALDYARFLDLYMQRGRAGGKHLLRASSVSSTLEPGRFPLPSSSGFGGLRTDYGTLMQLWTRAVERTGERKGESKTAGEAESRAASTTSATPAARETVVFGHTGSDGTHAWAFPDAKAMVLYFTQSRGTTTGVRVEERLGELFLGLPFDPLEAAPPLEQYLGYYWEGEGDLYRAIVRSGKDLALEIVGKAVVPLDYIGDDRWKLRPEPANVIAFDRDATGRVTGYHIGEHAEYRFDPRTDLPSADDVAARVAAAHHIERLSDAGVVRLRGRIEMPKLDRRGESTLCLAWPNRWRADEMLGKESGSAAFDGQTLRTVSGGRAVATVEGRAAELMLQDSSFWRFGDWRRNGTALTVVQELKRGDDHVWLVRAGDCSAPGTTLYVDAATGRVGRVDGLTYLEGMGVIGQKVIFNDWREVGGALLPFRVQVELAHPLIGKIVTTYESFETGVEVEPGWFELEANGAGH